MVLKLQLFSIYSFLHVLLDPHKKNSCWKGANKNDFSFVQMWDNVVCVHPCFKTLVGSKTNSSSDNP
jgi:hypothetical protein